MTKILIVTVGGSHKPICTAIETLQPDRVIFVCSDRSKTQIIGSGTPCEIRNGSEVIERLPNIPTQLKLGDRFQPDQDIVLVTNPDDPSECYNKIARKLQELSPESPDNQIFVDYTGGTKTMGFILGLIAVDYDLSLYLTTADRNNIIKVDFGQSTERANISSLLVNRTIQRLLPTFLEQFNYSPIIAELQSFLIKTELPQEEKTKIRQLKTICQGLDDWDRFNHLDALKSLQTQMKIPAIQNLCMFLKRVINSRSEIDTDFKSDEKLPGHGYEIVEDLLLNAERKAIQKRYDDAVGRLYRALELFIQIRLRKEYEIKTSEIDLTKLPTSLHSEYESKKRENKIKLALKDSYELLTKLNSSDQLGQLYTNQKNRITDALNIRNHSLFAHGFKPISEHDYERLKNIIHNFVTQGISLIIDDKFKKMSPVQFPTKLDL